jgi:formylglycine-generating enzyme required for sulfatase activity
LHLRAVEKKQYQRGFIMKIFFYPVILAITATVILSGGCSVDPTNPDINSTIPPPDTFFINTPQNLRVDTPSIRIYANVTSPNPTFSGRFLLKWDRLVIDTSDTSYIRETLFDTTIIITGTDTTKKIDTTNRPYTRYYVMIYYNDNNSKLKIFKRDTGTFDSLSPNVTYTVSVYGMTKKVILWNNKKDTLDVRSKKPATLIISDLYQPMPPKNVIATYDGNAAIRVSWTPNTGAVASWYRVYLRDSISRIVDSAVSTDTSRSMAFFPSSPDKKTVLPNRAYKINIRSVNKFADGILCSTFVYDKGSNSDTGYTLPFLYVSTYGTPPALVPDSFAGTLIGVPGGMYSRGNIWTKDSLKAAKFNKPVHEVILPSFYLSSYEITIQQYIQFLNGLGAMLVVADTNIIDTIKKDTTTYRTFSIKGDTILNDIIRKKISVLHIVKKDSLFSLDSILYALYPQTRLTWIGAAAFCNWLSKKKTLGSCYDEDWAFLSGKNGFRLPTEAEFEYVQSAAFTGTKQRFPWGYAINEFSFGSQKTKLGPVGRFLGWYGFFDLSGNVNEWCHDYGDDTISVSGYSDFYTQCLDAGVVLNPVDSANSWKGHSLRGGSYVLSPIRNCSVWRTASMYPGIDIGFRIARNN